MNRFSTRRATKESGEPLNNNNKNTDTKLKIYKFFAGEVPNKLIFMKLLDVIFKKLFFYDWKK